MLTTWFRVLCTVVLPVQPVHQCQKHLVDDHSLKKNALFAPSCASTCQINTDASTVMATIDRVSCDTFAALFPS